MNQKEKEFSTHLFALSSSPTIGELKKKYRELIKLYHPDKHPENIESSTRLVQKINEAYEILLGNLHHIFSDNLAGDFVKKMKIKEKNTCGYIVSMGDSALRDAVIIGWLKRTPKDDFAHKVRERIEKALSLLNTIDVMEPHIDKILFYTEIFSAFLCATAPKKPSPLPEVYNATRFFHHYARGNKHLDSGIRNYYRFTENGKKLTLPNIPLSFLADAIQLYIILRRKIKDTVLLEQIQAKIKLAELFKLRIQYPDVTLL